MKTVTIEIEKELHDLLEHRAVLAGQTVSEYLQALLIVKSATKPQRNKEKRGLERYFGCFDSGDPNSADNEKIDRILAEEAGRGLDFP